MTNDELARKRVKAEHYAKEPERFMFANLEIQMQSTHDMRLIHFGSGKWTCSCDFFKRQDTCSHLMAIQDMLKHFRFELSE